MTDQVLTMREVCAETRLCRQTIWKLHRAGAFPKPIRLGLRRLGWRRSAINAWLDREAA